MAILQIDLFDQTNNRRIWVSLRDNLPILDLIQKLVSDLELKQGEYELLDEDSGRKLSEEATLKEEGIEDQQLLRLRKKKKIPVIVPIPIIPPGQVSAETKVPPGVEPRPSAGAAIPEKESGAQAPQPSKTGAQPLPKAEGEPPKGRKAKPTPTARPARGKLSPPPARLRRPGPPDHGMPGGFWHRPLPQPRFLRWIPFSLWIYLKPILILAFVLFMILCCLAGMCTSRVTGFGQKCPPTQPCPPQTITVTPVKKAIHSPLDAPYTYKNNAAYDQFTAGNIDQGTRFSADDIDYNRMISEFTQKRIIELSGSCSSRPDVTQKLVLVAVNEGGLPLTQEHYAWFREPEKGEDYLALIDPLNKRMRINLAGSSGAEQWDEFIPEEIVVYNPGDEQCWEYATFLAFNIDQTPFDNLDFRRALIYSFDSTAYYNQVFVENEGMAPAAGLAPQAILKEEVSPDFVSYKAPFDMERGRSLLNLLKTGGWLGDYADLDDLLHPTYCNACTGMDVETSLIVSMWQENLGIGGSAVPEDPDNHWQPIRGTNRSIYNMTYGHSNYYSFIYGVLNDGWIMLPSSGQAKALNLLEQYANANDLSLREELIGEIDYLILEEYAVALPLYYFSSCD